MRGIMALVLPCSRLLRSERLGYASKHHQGRVRALNMALCPESRQAVKDIVTAFANKVLQSATSEDRFDEAKFRTRRPFDAALVPVAIWRGSHFERKFVTARGQVGFESIARIVSEDAGHMAQTGRVSSLQIHRAQLEEINAIVAKLREPRRGGGGTRPHWSAERARVMAAARGPKTTTIVTSDLYVKTQDGREMFFSLKSSKPNIDQCQIAKQDILKLLAAQEGCEAYFALPDNPYGEPC